jgi:hypothetical protein
MQPIVTRMIWNFDIELCEGSRTWDKQKVFMLNWKLSRYSGIALIRDFNE